ncbi:hypothetical protein LIER_36051 [Lithospermum erythrorhizon]|uniref:Uncharacterized protein n=1 Tax=Lithospermum erythrorhizon TaxID=34254 RepID=A0AAV3NZZ2_LITER
MYPSSTSSSSQGSLGPNTNGLSRYDSAPSSSLTSAVDSVIATNPNRDFFSSHHNQNHLAPSRYFSKTNGNNTNKHSIMEQHQQQQGGGKGGASSSNGFRYMLGDISGGGGAPPQPPPPPPSLVRHRSSPAGFLSQLVQNHASNDDGFLVRRGIENFTPKGVPESGHIISRLNTQLSFTRKEALSQITEETEELAERINNDNSGQRKSSTSFANNANFRGRSWEDSNTIMFSTGTSKKTKNNDDMFNGIDGMESQVSIKTCII